MTDFIYRDRPFNESNLPPRRQLRSDTLKQKSPPLQRGRDLSTTDGPRRIEHYFKRDGPVPRKSRGTTPVENSNEGRNTGRNGNDVGAALETTGISMRRSSSRSPQAKLPIQSPAHLSLGVEEPESAGQPTFEVQKHPNDLSNKDFEINRIKKVVESPPGSPGVDPRKAVPPSAEDVADLQEPVVLGANDQNYHAAVAHLPPKEAQEARLEEAEKTHENKGERIRHLLTHPLRIPVEVASSPSSTIDAHSTTTPAHHDASTDTSPENDNSRYEDVERPDNENDIITPTESKSIRGDTVRGDEDSMGKNIQNEPPRTELLDSSPMAADAQLRMEDQAASGSKVTAIAEIADSEASSSQGTEEPKSMAREASNVEKEAPHETSDDVSDVSRPVEEGRVEKPHRTPRENEVPDSEGEGQTPLDAMDVDGPTVKYSSESQTTLESSSAANGKALTPAEDTPMQPSSDSTTPLSKPSPSGAPASTVRRTPSSTPAPVQAPIERMTTRVASGAIRHKSVSEILGEIPAPNAAPISARSPTSKIDTGSALNSPSRGSSPGSPRSLLQKTKEKTQSRLSTVVFAKMPSGSKANDVSLMPRGAMSQLPDPYDDYFACLYLNSHNTQKTGYPPLDGLLQTAHKTITTSNSFVPITENQTTRILKRIYGLQNSHKWSLRQPKRSEEPIRPATHWDVLLQEAKWMRTDFREERKWKMAVAKNMAFACAEWFEATTEERKILQVNALRPPMLPAEAPRDVETRDQIGQLLSHPILELIACTEVISPMDYVDEQLRLNITDTVSSTAIFGLQDDDVVFGLNRAPATDKILEELPLYGAPLTVPCNDLPTSQVDPDRFWRRPAVAISKYVEGRMELKYQGPPRKKSRFEYEEDSEEEDGVTEQSGNSKSILPPEQTNVGLFDPANKHIRDRIHAGHQFRPPTEHPMPTQNFFEQRQSSLWTSAEDDELKKLVREYAYNWSLISNMLSSRSLYSSGAERRTPWECFERWIILEGLPADMQKTAYFKAYNNRLDSAQRHLQLLATQAPQQQPNGNGQIIPPRRRNTISQRVDKRRNQKHLTLVDAMRKLAKKRENTAQKQQLSAAQAAARRPAEAPQPWGEPVKRTPQEFSYLKHQREEAFKERMAVVYQQRQELAKRVSSRVQLKYASILTSQ